MKKMIIEDINIFCTKCGFFYNAFIENGIIVNSGYNCRHEKQKQIYAGIGCCYCDSCPLGVQAEEKDFKDESIDNNGYEYEEGRFLIVEVD